MIRQLGATALFAAKFRENAARSLLLPKRRPGTRAPLWQQRKRAADLLAVAARFGSFPVLLETYRECLRDFFDMPALVQTLTDVRSRATRLVTVDSSKPSPFAASLLFSYVASFLYDGDAPLAERRAQALAVDQGQLRELLGDPELRELLDAGAFETVERQLQRLDPSYLVKSVGDMTSGAIAARTAPDLAHALPTLVSARRVVGGSVAGEERYFAVEDAARFRDALGVPLATAVPQELSAPVSDPLGDLALRYARTHAPFTTADFATRFGLPAALADRVLHQLASESRLLEGEFRPGGFGREWVAPDVLRMLRRRSLAKLRREVEPVDQPVLGRLATAWQGITRKHKGTSALLEAIEQLQGAPLAASLVETEILPGRVEFYDPVELDGLLAAGEVLWVGLGAVGDHDGRIALFLADHAARLLPPDPRWRSSPPSQRRSIASSKAKEASPDNLSDRERAIVGFLGARGASFFAGIHQACGGGYPGETLRALWSLVWAGRITNDSFQSLRAFTQVQQRSRRRERRETPALPPRRLVPPTAEGRWTLVRDDAGPGSAPNRSEHTTWAAAVAQQLLARHGVLTREAVMSEAPPGGFGLVYPVLKAMEESGKLRRDYFVSGLGATQFALPGALDLLRSLREMPEVPEVAIVAATDPANPYGATLKWPASAADGASASEPNAGNAAAAGQADLARGGEDARAEYGGRGPARAVGAAVVLVNGALAAYLTRGDRALLTWLPEVEPLRSHAARAIAQLLIERARSGGDTPRGMLIEEIDGRPATTHPLGPFLSAAGFLPGALGFQATFPRPRASDHPLSLANAFGP